MYVCTYICVCKYVKLICICIIYMYVHICMYFLSSNTTLPIHLFPVGHSSPPVSPGVGPHSPHHTSVSPGTAHHPTTQSTGHTTNTYRVPRTLPEHSVKPTTAEQGHSDRYVYTYTMYTHSHMHTYIRDLTVSYSTGGDKENLYPLPQI